MDRIFLRISFFCGSVLHLCTKNAGAAESKGSSCAVLQLFPDLHAFIYESSEKAGTCQDFILQPRDVNGHNTNIMILWSGLS